jgi:hypothetical protein
MVAVPTPLDWVGNAGNFASAAMLKAGVEDVLRFLLDPPRVRVRSGVAQSIPTSSYTALAFATEDYDNEATATHLSGTGMHDTVTNNSRLTCRTAGTYLLTGQVGHVGSASGRRGVRWDLNGGVLNGCQNIWAPGVATGVAYPAPVILVPMLVGDFVELKTFQEPGSSQNTVATAESQSRAEARWVGP